jgi:hypothetical protein
MPNTISIDEVDPLIGLIDKRRLAKHLDLSIATVDRLRRKKIIPCYKIDGGAVRFRLPEVLKAIESYRLREISL